MLLGRSPETLTFIEDPVEPGVMYVRDRFYAGLREAGSVEPTSTPTQDATPNPTVTGATPLIPTVTPSRTPNDVPGALYLPWLKGECRLAYCTDDDNCESLRANA